MGVRFQVVLAAFLAGCGSSYCETVAKNLEDCEGTYEATEEELESCEQMLEPCSAADESQLLDYERCLQDAGGGYCPEDFEVGTSSGTSGLPSWMEAMITCQAEIQDLSAECLSAMGMGTATQQDL